MSARANVEMVKKLFKQQGKRYEMVHAFFNAAICKEVAGKISKDQKLQNLLLKYTKEKHLKDLPKKFVAATHALFYAKKADNLAQFLIEKSTDYDELWNIVSGLINEFEEFYEYFLYLKVIDEDIGRSAILIAALSKLCSMYPLPINLYQLQARAGLNMVFDQFSINISGYSWGNESSPIEIKPIWDGVIPRLDFKPNIINRYGSDKFAMNLNDPIEQLRLRAYVSTNNSLRLDELSDNISIVQNKKVKIDHLSNADWAKEITRKMNKGQMHFIFHMCSWSEMNEDLKAACEIIEENALRYASQDRPIAHLAFEYNDEDGVGEVIMRVWDNAKHYGKVELLGKSDQFGEQITWYDQNCSRIAV